jgi:prepilin-type N-terminal cleavage/methylation domain-containing protein
MNTHCSEKGFSLVELMVALGIMLVGMSAVGVMLLSSFEGSRYNRNVRNAETVLRYFSEQFSAGNLGPGSPEASLPTTGTAVVRDGQVITDTADTKPGLFYCSWTSTPYGTSKLNQLDVVVGWGKSRGSALQCTRDTPDQCPFVLRMSNFY